MASDVMTNMEKLSRSNLDNLRAEKKIGAGQQKAELRDKLKAKIDQHKQRFDPKPPPQPEQPAPAPTAKQWTARETIALNRRANELHSQGEAKKAEPRRQDKVRKLMKYAVRFPEICAPFKKQIRVDMSEAEADTLLLRIREVLGEKGSKQMCDKLLWGVFMAAEKITHDFHFNPLKLQIRGISNAVAFGLTQKGFRDSLEPEISEMEIEIGGRFHAPWYARLGVKLADFTLAFSNRQKQMVAGQFSSRPVGDLPPMQPPPGVPAPTSPAPSPPPQDNVAQ